MITPIKKLSEIILGMVLTTSAFSLAQATEDYKVPRLADGTPDFQGVWTNSSLTSMTRPDEFKELIIPAEKIEEINYNAGTNRRLREDNKATDPNAPAPTAGGRIKGYNNFWVDPGDSYAKVKGEYRSSWVISPGDGKVPYTPLGREVKRNAYLQRGGDVYAGPEARTVGDRCLISFGSSAGPPMNNVLYNNHYQFVQTPHHVMINVEMNHDARIIDINGEHNPKAVREWFGSSIGHWEGDTLVVETKNVHPIQEKRGSIAISEQGNVIEKFTRVAENELLYEFTVEDPKYYSQAWSGEMTFHRDGDAIFEYACHEGNYGMEGILAGARRQEAKEASAAK